MEKYNGNSSLKDRFQMDKYRTKPGVSLSCVLEKGGTNSSKVHFLPPPPKKGQESRLVLNMHTGEGWGCGSEAWVMGCSQVHKVTWGPQASFPSACEPLDELAAF